MNDPVGEIIGDYRGFVAQQHARLLDRGIDIRPFHRLSLQDSCVLMGARFDGFVHVDDWVPQRLVRATGPNPLPR